jgi:phage terminase large subunit-like protein
MCAANSVIASDPAGNRKLDKKRASGRIDGMVALAMALAAAPAAWTAKVDIEALIG